MENPMCMKVPQRKIQNQYTHNDKFRLTTAEFSIQVKFYLKNF